MLIALEIDDTISRLHDIITTNNVALNWKSYTRCFIHFVHDNSLFFKKKKKVVELYLCEFDLVSNWFGGRDFFVQWKLTEKCSNHIDTEAKVKQYYKWFESNCMYLVLNFRHSVTAIDRLRHTQRNFVSVCARMCLCSWIQFIYIFFPISISRTLHTLLMD